MLRVSVTTLEKYRRYMKEVSPLDTEDSLLETISGRFTGNPKTEIGSSFHKLIEIGPVCVHSMKWTPPQTIKQMEERSAISHNGLFIKPGTCKVGDVTFTMDQVNLAIKYRLNYKGLIPEIPLYRIYQVPRLGEVMVTAKVDGIAGRTLRDIKVKFRAPDLLEYIESLQWRIYLDMLNVDAFFYDIFELQGYDEQASDPLDVSGCQLKAHEPLQCARYLDLSTEVEYWIHDFFNYIHDKNLFDQLKKANVYEYENSIF